MSVSPAADLTRQLAERAATIEGDKEMLDHLARELEASQARVKELESIRDAQLKRAFSQSEEVASLRAQLAESQAELAKERTLGKNSVSRRAWEEAQATIEELRKDRERLIYIAKYADKIDHCAMGDTGNRNGVTIWPAARGTEWFGYGRDFMEAFRSACDKIIAFEQEAIDAAKEQP